MDEKRIGEIVRKVHQIANENCVSDAPNALAIHVEDEIFELYKKKISYRTIERAFKRHISNDKTVSERNPESISILCMYLGFDDYRDYIKKNPLAIEGGIDISSEVIDEPPKRPYWKLIIAISLGLGTILTIVLIFKNQVFPNEKYLNKHDKKIDYPTNQDIAKGCMTWADSLYVAVSCDESPLSEYGTEVKPLDPMELKNMRKVDVRAGYPFFTEEGKPRIWYYRNKNNEFEYFTAPGFHPVNEETLRKITEGIIDKYVPTHLDNKDSFLE